LSIVQADHVGAPPHPGGNGDADLVLLLHLLGNGFSNDLEKVVEIIKVYPIVFGVKMPR